MDTENLIDVVENPIKEPIDELIDDEVTTNDDIILSDGTIIAGIISISTNFLNRTLTIGINHLVSHAIFNDKVSPVTIAGTVYDYLALKNVYDENEQTYIVLAHAEDTTRLDALEESQEMQDEIIADMLDTM